jgi:hypothetical protein
VNTDTPKLDDRTFADLVADAEAVIERVAPQWSDRSPHDPGMVLVELFAYITEMMLFRLNRVPDKAYLAFLQLLGVRLHAPSAAHTTLRFTRTGPGGRPVEIPRGTRVTAGRAGAVEEAPVFMTLVSARLRDGESEIDVPAQHAEQVDAELAGVGTGRPGQRIATRRAPIVAPGGDGLELVVAIEVGAGELDESDNALEHEGKPYRVWREVETFAEAGGSQHVYIADRISGTITFAPAAHLVRADGTLEAAPTPLAAVPPKGREIRLWYRFGGGVAGNVPANSLTTLKDSVPAVRVDNPQPAVGGRASETLDNAVRRGPIEFHTLHRAVTASDFELLAMRSGAVGRAKAFTQATRWVHAPPGSVEVVLVPWLPDEARSSPSLDVAMLESKQTEQARAQIQSLLDDRRPLGTRCVVSWARYKSVRVEVRVVVYREEDPGAVKTRVLRRLYSTITPLGTPLQPEGWRFGHPLRPSDVYGIVLSEPGVSFADRVLLVVESAPEAEVRSLAADAHQPLTWHAASGDSIFRSMDDGEGWDPVLHVSGERVDVVRVHHEVPGIVAAATWIESGVGADDGESTGKVGSRIHVSQDTGESWALIAQPAFRVADLAWTTRDGVPLLIMATDVGLYELALSPNAAPIQLSVNPEVPDQGFFAVAVARDATGQVHVAASAQNTRGIFLSSEGGRSGTFRGCGLVGKDVRVLAFQADRVRLFLWAGVSVPGFETGEGCWRLDLTPPLRPSANDWGAYGSEWRGASVRSLAFHGGRVMAASHRAGVLVLDPSLESPVWWAPHVGCGLPLAAEELQPVVAVASNADGSLLLVGGKEGVYRSEDVGVRYDPASLRAFTDKVTLSPGWLFVSAVHEVEVLSEDDAGRD